jgi:MFS family permease
MRSGVVERSETLGGWFFGWKVVAAAFVVAVFAWGLGFYGPSVFLHTLHDSRGWPLSVIGAAITTHFLFSAVLVAQLADVHRRFGVVATTRAGAVALALGVVGWSLAAQPWQLFGAALVSGVGWAATGGAAIVAMVAPWFKRRMGLALSLAFNGASVGGVLFTPLWLCLIDRIGFAVAATLIAALTLAVLWPLAGRYLRPTPESPGLAPDGDGIGVDPTAGAPRPPLSRRALLGEKRFLTLATAAALALFAQIGVIAILVALLVGPLGETGAAAAVSLTTSCAIVGRLLVGLLPARVDWRLVAAANFLMQAGGIGLLAGGGGAPPLLIGCALFGLGLGNAVSLLPLVAQAEFERIDVGRVIALVTAINQALFSFAPAAFGTLHDIAGDWQAPLAGAAGLELMAATIVVLGRQRAGRASPRSPRAGARNP